MIGLLMSTNNPYVTGGKGNMKKIGITGVAGTILFIIVSLFAAATAHSEIYINNFPADIAINEGEPLDVPIFFDGKSYANKPVELFIFKEDLTNQAKAYLYQTGWVSFTDYAEVRPLASIDSMIEYANILWRAFDNTSGMNSLILGVCIDPTMSGQLTDEADCSLRTVLIEEQQNACLGLSLSDATVTKTVAGGQKVSVQISVKDMCNQDIAFDAASEQSWISLTKQTGGLTATLDASGLSPGSYNGSIQVNSGGVSKKIDVALTVSTQVCSGVTVSPTSISKTLTRGQQSGPLQISVKDSCGNNIAVTSFDATSDEPNWISLEKQTGGLTATLNSSSLLPGTHNGVVKVSSGGVSANVSITMTVNPPGFTLPGDSCAPSSLRANPVSLTLNSGETKSQSASITNNCGVAASYTATVASGSSWLTAQSSGSGTMSVTGNAAGMSAGTYQGSVSVTSGGLGTATLNVTMTVLNTGPCEPSTVNVSPSSISRTSSVGTNVSNETLTIKDNCGNNLPYTVTAVTGSWISSPQAQDAGTGSLTVSFNTTALAGSYDGSIALDLGSFGTKNISVKVTLSNIDNSVVELSNFKNVYYSFNAKEVRYFRFIETSNKGLGNINPTWLEMMDMTQSSGMHNIEMLVKYAGPNCEYGKPTLQDYTETRAGNIKPGEDGLYFSYSTDAFESISIRNNQEGCYYVMVYNASDGYESRISIKYYDGDSKSYSQL